MPNNFFTSTADGEFALCVPTYLRHKSSYDHASVSFGTLLFYDTTQLLLEEYIPRSSYNVAEQPIYNYARYETPCTYRVGQRRCFPEQNHWNQSYHGLAGGVTLAC